MHLIITATTASLLGMLLVALSAITIRARLQNRTPFGDGGQHGLTSAIRAHGNLTEYAPMGIILIGLLESLGAAHLPLGLAAAAFVVSRVLNAVGLFNPPGPPTLARSAGIVATLLVLTGLSIWLFVLIHLPHGG